MLTIPKANQTGTYWYHSHDATQYPDGLWGPLIIHDPNPPFEFDEEITMTLSDFYNEQMPDLIHQYESHAGEAKDGTPTPSGGALLNSAKNVSIPMKPGKTYLVHIICPAGYSGVAWIFEGHDMTTVEVDGTYIKPTNTNAGGNLARVAPGQRQSVLISTKNDTSTNYAIWASLDVNILFIDKGIIPPPANYNTNVTAWFVYNESAPLPDPPVFHELGNPNFYDDINYEPLDDQPVLGPVDHQIVMNTQSANISGISR